MAYASSTVKVPVVNGKIIFKTKSEHVYVLYETGRKYDRKKQYNVPTRVVIGKLVDKNDKTKMFPNKKFSEYFPDVVIAPLAEPSKRSNTLHVGSFIALSTIVKEYGLKDLLEKTFGQKAGLILDLVNYMIINEDNAGQYYPDYARCHPLFTEDMHIASDSMISRLLTGMQRDQITEFLDHWNKKQDHRQRIYISYDSTNKNSQSGDVDFVEFGHAKVDQGLPIINISVAFDKTNQIPLFYEEYPGSINDVSQLAYLIDKIEAYGYQSVGIILDRGYFSKANIEYMDKKKLQFLMMVKGCKPLVSSVIEQQRGNFETDRNCHISGSSLYGMTIRRPLWESSDKERYFHLYFNPMKMATERQQLEWQIERMASDLKKLEGRECEIAAPFTRYFDCHYKNKGKSKIFLFAQEKSDVIKQELEFCGYFCLVSSSKMTAQEAYRLYRGRDVSEKLFRADKSFLGAKSHRVHSNEAVSAKIFIEFVALIVRNRFYNLLKDEVQRLGIRRNYMTVPAAIRELEKIEMTRRNAGAYLMDFALTKNQKTILQSFGLNQEQALERAQKISSDLAKVKDQPAEQSKDEDDDHGQTEECCFD